MQNLTETIFISIKYLDYVFFVGHEFLNISLPISFHVVQAHERRALCFEKVCVCV